MEEFLYNIPQPLFKYRDWGKEFNRRTLTECEIYLASSIEFNDPFDASLPFRYKEEDLTPDNIFEKLYEMGKDQWPNISDKDLIQRCYERQSSGVFETGEYWKEEYPAFKKRMENFGILSLTSKKDNLLMWSHYANSHTGFCVGFDKYILFEEIKGQLGKVIYSNEFPKADLFNDGMKNLIALTCTKFKDWEYEDEYRIAKIDSANQIIKLPDEAILEIILGMKMKGEDKDKILEFATRKYPKAKVYEASMNLELFQLDMIPILKAPKS